MYYPKSTHELILYITPDFDPDTGENIYKYLLANKNMLIQKSVEKKTGKREWHVLFRSWYKELFRTQKNISTKWGSIICAIDNTSGYFCIDSCNVAIIHEKYLESENGDPPLFFKIMILRSRSIQ
jgi:hypothetical protein